MVAEQPDRRYDRVLVVAAHPDDPEFLFGATVARLADSGAAVVYVICTDGSQGGEDPAVPSAELSAVRCAEQRAAAAVLGVADVVFLGLPDGRLAPTLDLRRAVAREIRRFGPELVLTHVPFRLLSADIGFSHPDHVAVGEATLSAVHLLPEAHDVAGVWIPGLEHPDHYVDATGLIERKIEAILCHRSQLHGGETQPDAIVDWVRDRARRAGEQSGYEYAERFNRIMTAKSTRAAALEP